MRCRSFVAFFAAWLPVVSIADSSSASKASPIPRSTHRLDDDFSRFPPWNLSPMIDENGFLLRMYKRVPGEFEKEVKFLRRPRPSNAVDLPAIVRQVPGDGNCLFHSISTCFAYTLNGTHVDLKDRDCLRWLYQHSAMLRQQAVDCLEEKRKVLYIQGNDYFKSKDLVETAASQYGISGSKYCELMRQDSYWGGGPEIVALCNVLRRPIHVYELAVEDDTFVLRRMACFGSPKFDNEQALHILSADSRFPDLTPGNQLQMGNHFLAMFPEKREQASESKRRLRGGAGVDLPPTLLDEDGQARGGIESDAPFVRKRWWRRLLTPKRSKE